MREEEEETTWFARWEEQLPSPDELMPLSQSLITPDLALAFDIPTGSPAAHNPGTALPLHAAMSDSLAGGGGGGAASSGGGGEEMARTLKRPRLVWTPQLHKRFVDAVAHLGIKNAVPKTIMQLMNVDGLTRENVASHLQKYRLYLKRMQSGGGAGGAGGGHNSDAATDQLFASAPIPHQFLSASASHNFLSPYVSPPPSQPPPPTQQPFIGHFNGGVSMGLDRGSSFFGRTVAQTGVYGRMVGPPMAHPGLGFATMPPPMSSPSPFGDELELGGRGTAGSGGARRELTLFPTSGER